MSGTTVHSRTEDNRKGRNIEAVMGETIPTETCLEIPPTSAKRTPSTMQVALGEGIEFQAVESSVNERGEIIGLDKVRVAVIPTEKYKALRQKAQDKKTRDTKQDQGKDNR